MKNYYYGIFKEDDGMIAYSIPAFKGVHGFADNLDEAIEDAMHNLALLIATKRKPEYELSFEQMENTYKGKIVAIPIQEDLVKLNLPTVRMNVLFKQTTKQKLDKYVEENAMNRSAFLEKITLSYFEKAESSGL